MRYRLLHISIILLIIIFEISGTNFAYTQKKKRDLLALSLDDLANLSVISVSKTSHKYLDAAAAIFVLNTDDIHRSGATTIADALRLVPGLEVAQVDGNKWAISGRGFNGILANKLLVLIDGRCIYNPIFSGVYWESQDLFLPDIDKIEIIRGPGATLWGSNAVNGVINIITKKAAETQYRLLDFGLGTEERYFGGFRYGGKLGKNCYYRWYTKYFNRDNTVDSTGHKSADNWNMIRGGFRLDWDDSTSHQLTIQGEVYNGTVGQTYRAIESLYDTELKNYNTKVPINGFNILNRWTHTFSGASDFVVQLYWDRQQRNSPIIDWTINTLDFDFQHRWLWGARHCVIWGLGYRLLDDYLPGNFPMSFDPKSRRLNIVNAFAQDEIECIDKLLTLTVGSKFEYNPYTCCEVQPNIRFCLTPYRNLSFWGAISQAVHPPSRSDNDVKYYLMRPPEKYVPLFIPNPVVVLEGNTDIQSEQLTAYEFGIRMVPVSSLLFDVSLFYNKYDKLRTMELIDFYVESIPEPTHLSIPLVANNKKKGIGYGFELATSYWFRQWCRFRAGYSYLQLKCTPYQTSKDAQDYFISEEGYSPNYHYFMQMMIDISSKFTFDAMFFYTDKLSSLGIANYTNADLRLSWKLSKQHELYVVGQNLLQGHHAEFRSEFSEVVASEVERGIYCGVRWIF
jgi:iron complex outermembrane recepter protein